MNSLVISIGSLYPDYTQRSHSPFNPKVEEASKRLLRETSEQIESSSRLIGRRPYPYETNPKDSIITKRRLESDFKHHDTSATIRPSQPPTYTTQTAPSGSLSEIFQQYHQPQNLNRSSAGGPKSVKGKRI